MDWSDTFSDMHAIFYSRAQLERLHRHLLHPSATKLYALLRRATNSAEKLPPDTLKTLKEISDTCKSCITFSPKQMVFHVRDTDNLRFNHEIIMDVMYLGNEMYRTAPVLHIVDAVTRFNAAAFLPGSDVNSVWNTFYSCGRPNTLVSQREC